MASKGFKVQPPPRVPRHDTVQVCVILVCLHSFKLQHSNGSFLDEFQSIWLVIEIVGLGEKIFACTHQLVVSVILYSFVIGD